MNVIKPNDTCWICKGKYKYIYEKNYEDLGYYTFKCENCGEVILSPKTNPLLVIEGEN